MTVATFDTLKYFNNLKEAGLPDKQAAAHVAVMSEALAVNLKEFVTKDDLKSALTVTEERLDARIKATEERLDAKISLLRTELKADLREIEQRLTAKFDLVPGCSATLIALGGTAVFLLVRIVTKT